MITFYMSDLYKMDRSIRRLKIIPLTIDNEFIRHGSTINTIYVDTNNSIGFVMFEQRNYIKHFTPILIDNVTAKSNTHKQFINNLKNALESPCKIQHFRTVHL